jgi:hypothetical protein
MAILLCEALNSKIGQRALAALDAGASRVAVHYLNEGKLAALLGQVRMKVSQILVTPEQTVMEWKEFNSKKGTIRKQLPRKIPESKKAKVTAQDIAAIHAVLDGFGGGLHLQTLYPSHVGQPSSAEWDVGPLKNLALLGTDGNITVHVTV